MANPQVVNILTEWVWEKVATNVVSGSIHRLTSSVYYYQTYRATGTTAPAAPTLGTIPEEAIRLFQESDQVPISASAAVDVYVMIANNDNDNTDTGKIRVDV